MEPDAARRGGRHRLPSRWVDLADAEPRVMIPVAQLLSTTPPRRVRDRSWWPRLVTLVRRHRGRRWAVVIPLPRAPTDYKDSAPRVLVAGLSPAPCGAVTTPDPIPSNPEMRVRCGFEKTRRPHAPFPSAEGGASWPHIQPERKSRDDLCQAE